MAFNDNKTLTDLYSNITKRVEPTADQLVRQAPLMSKTDLSTDQSRLEEAYDVMTSKGPKKCACKHAAKGCDCDGCEECRNNREAVEESKKSAKSSKPDYLDVDKDGNKKELMKKALKDKETMEEGSKFASFFKKIMTESVVCGTKINSQHQYDCITKDGESKVLKGESVVMMKDRLKSVKPTHKK